MKFACVPLEVGRHDRIESIDNSRRIIWNDRYKVRPDATALSFIENSNLYSPISFVAVV